MYNIYLYDVRHLEIRCKKLNIDFNYYYSQVPMGYVVILNEFGFTEIGKALEYLDKLEEQIKSLQEEL